MIEAKHTYRAPKGNRALRYLLPILGSLMFTFLVFYVIPLMKKLEGGARKEVDTFDEGMQVEPPPEFVQEEIPPPEVTPEEINEPTPELDAIDIPIDIPNLGAGGGGGAFLEINPGFGLSSDANDFSNEDLSEPPKVRTRARPRYPPALLKKKITGRVVVSALVEENGFVGNATTKESSGYPSMDRAAERAVLRWRFKPGIQGGRKVRSTVLVPINFKISNK